MMSPRTECIEGFEKLKNDLPDLDSTNFREHWFYRARAFLLDTKCSYRYGILMRLAESRLREGRGIGIDRINIISNSNSNSTISSKEEQDNGVI